MRFWLACLITAAVCIDLVRPCDPASQICADEAKRASLFIKTELQELLAKTTKLEDLRVSFDFIVLCIYLDNLFVKIVLNTTFWIVLSTDFQ